ncbi:hypothetical protein M3Y99_00373500 [Aphelenchoides fujianensis]|nr:hypothetical protein M3Y99_00373500 [Aphelenchoides fujianensis]
MSVELPEVDRIIRLLGTHNFRDKTLRNIYFALILYSTKIKDDEQAKRVFALAKQLSLTRLVLRQLNHLPLLRSLSKVPEELGNSSDRVDTALNASVSLVYTVQSFVEFGAWIGDAKVVRLDAPKWFRWSLYLWILAMAGGVLRLLRRILYVEPLHDRLHGPADKQTLDARQSDRLSLLGLGCDLVAGISTLPHDFLWAGRMSKRTTASLSLVASAVSLYKLF